MIPWRPLGMLVFGLTVIFIFIRLHGNGYDFPVRIARCKDKLEFRKPDRTYMEISGVYHDHFRDWNADHAGSEGDSKDHEQRFMAGWSSQWHLGKKKNKQADPAISASNDIDLGVTDNIQQWIWMTNIWHDDGDCGPGHLRQYRRRLDHTLASDNTSTWELMYVHKFPGVITHSSLSKRIISEPPLGDVQGTDGISSTEQTSRESIRLAIVYKVAREESVIYHSRVYHFGIFQGISELGECKSKSTETETCHTHEPFLNFDYTLPGSMSIKDFTLEHDTIIYSRLGDTTAFRSLKLPRLEPGSTSFQHPYVLPSGEPGTALDCRAKGNLPYRKSFLVKVPSDRESDDFHVMIGQVLEYDNAWIYRVDIESETTDINTGGKKWLKSSLLQRENSKLTVQEPNMIDEESHTYGYPVQKPFVIRSADGSSFHMPVADRICSLEIKQGSLAESNGNQEVQHSQQTLNKKSGAAGYRTLSSIFRSQWSETRIDIGSTYSMDTDYGVVSDAGDIMALKTTEVLAMKVVRVPMQFSEEMDSAKNKGKDETAQDPDEQDKKDESVSPSAHVPENQVAEIHNILGMIAVVAAFVISEAR
ncbi:hypothetical protein BGZ79_004132 [Entomortierella chlamydospora]|nr:hypothetical protein BGZ79_004132 [Entomortierella chlamydospora]